MKYLAPIIVLVAFAFAVEGTPPCYVRAVQVRHHGHYVAPVVATYGHHYQQSYSIGFNPVEAVLEFLDKDRERQERRESALQQELSAMRQMLLQGGVAPGLLPLKEDIHPGMKVALDKCASCHNDTNKKGGFQMFKGGDLVLDKEAADAVIRRAFREKTMPPKEIGPLSAEERLDLLMLLSVDAQAASK